MQEDFQEENIFQGKKEHKRSISDSVNPPPPGLEQMMKMNPSMFMGQGPKLSSDADMLTLVNRHQPFHSPSETQPPAKSIISSKLKLDVKESTEKVTEPASKSPIYFMKSMPPGLTPPKKSTPDLGFFKPPPNLPPVFKKEDSSENSPINWQAGLPSGEEKTGKSAAQFIPKKPIILEETRETYTGRLKFFDETKNFGFLVMDSDRSDIFVHYDDLVRADLDKEKLRSVKNGNVLRFRFSCMSYIGKYNKSRKAIDLELIKDFQSTAFDFNEE